MRPVIIICLILTMIVTTLSWAQDNPIRDSRVGEWATYSTANPAMQERHSVIARQRQVLVVRVDSIINGKVISSRTENFNIDDPSFMGGAEGRQQVTAGGRTFNCVAIQRGDRTLFYSNQVPVTGLVKIVRGNQTIKEIVDFGQ